MARTGRRMFGPLTYVTLAVALALGAYVEVGTYLERLERRHQIARLVRDAHDQPDPARRHQAAESLLREDREAATPHLLEWARDPRPEVRELACHYLAGSWELNKDVIPALIAASADPEAVVRMEAVRSLGRVAGLVAHRVDVASRAQGLETRGLGVPARAALGRAIADPWQDVRAAATEALGEFGGQSESLAMLRKALDDKERIVQLSAARSLLKASGPDDRDAIRTLLTLLSDPEPVGDRATVLKALMGMGDEMAGKAVAALAQMLHGQDPLVVGDVIDCLRDAGPQAVAALPALEAVFDGPDTTLRPTAGLAIVAIEGPGKGPRSRKVLSSLILDESLPLEKRQEAAGTLAEVDPAAAGDAAPGLIRQLSQPNVTRRQEAAELLQLIVSYAPARIPIPTRGQAGGNPDVP